MECSACKQCFDLDCLNISEQNYNKYTANYKRTWNCPTCVCSQPKSDNSGTSVGTSKPEVINPNTASENVNKTRGSRAKASQVQFPATVSEPDTSLLLSEIRLLRQQVCDLKQQNSDIGLKLSDVSEALNQRLEDFNRKIIARDNEILLLKDSIAQLQHKLVISEQENMKSELEIIGVPEENNENLVHISMVTAQKIGVQLIETDIDEVYRAGQRRTNLVGKPRSIVLRLTRRIKRTELLKAAKERRPLSSADIIQGTSSKMYINERLTKNNRLLFREARSRAQLYKFQYCWVRNGTIYVRKAEKQPSIPIRTPLDLDEKVGISQTVDTTSLDDNEVPRPITDSLVA